jgi:hypothetical protein
MAESLINVRNYGAFTFLSTSHALKAEKVLKQSGHSFLMIPTPRQISTSCGLAVKVLSGDLEAVSRLLNENSVQVDAVYRISLVNGKTQAERVENA